MFSKDLFESDLKKMIRESVRQTRLREPGAVRTGSGAAGRAQNTERSLHGPARDAAPARWLNFRALRNAMARGWRPGEPVLPEDAQGLPEQVSGPEAAPIRRLVQRLQQGAAQSSGAAAGAPVQIRAGKPKKDGAQGEQHDFPPQPQEYEPLNDKELFIRLHAPKESYVKNSVLDFFGHTQTIAPAISERVCETGKTTWDLRDDLSRFGQISKVSMDAYKAAERAAEQLGLSPAQLNAYRHVLWSCAMNRVLNNPDLAYNIMRNHEECAVDPEQKLGTLDSETDLWNNRYGITMSKKHSAKSCEAIAMEAIRRMKPAAGNKEK